MKNYFVDGRVMVEKTAASFLNLQNPLDLRKVIAAYVQEQIDANKEILIHVPVLASNESFNTDFSSSPLIVSPVNGVLKSVAMYVNSPTTAPEEICEISIYDENNNVVTNFEVVENAVKLVNFLNLQVTEFDRFVVTIDSVSSTPAAGLTLLFKFTV